MPGARSKILGRNSSGRIKGIAIFTEPTRKFQVVWSAEVDHMTSDFLKAVSTKFCFDPFICLKKPFPKE